MSLIPYNIVKINILSLISCRLISSIFYLLSMKDFDIKVMFGLRLRQIRKAKGISQEKLMMSTGIHRTYISEVERGIRNISIVNVYKISQNLEVDIRDLFDFTELNT